MERYKEQPKIFKKILIIILWVLVIYSGYWSYQAWDYTQEHPQERYEYNSYEEMPEEAAEKVRLYKKAQNGIYAGFIFTWVFFIVDYLDRPNEHWLRHVVKFFKKLEDDESSGEENGNGKV